MSIVGEAILTVIVEMLVEKLVSEVPKLFGRQEKILADLKDWRGKLEKIKAVLDDAEDKQLTDEKVMKWLGELRNLAYDVEDILDEFATEALKRDRPSTSMFEKLIIVCCPNLSPRAFGLNSEMRHNIDDITRRFQDIIAEKDQLRLKENSGGGKDKIVGKTTETTSLVRKAEVYGREEDKKAIVQLLLKDDGGLSVIPIRGMGGLGKTTLAQLIYNDETVETHFDLRGWACVSEDFDAIKVTKSILKSIGVQTKLDDDLNCLHGKLNNVLSGKKFLFVLDDLWNENPNDWELLSGPFEAGSPGSKIIVTTRNEGVSLMVTTGEVYSLRTLSNADCLCLFAQHSLRSTDFSAHQHLQEIGVKIVKKCNGLPLAAKTLGGLLRGKEIGDWEKVLNSKMWELPEEKSDIMRALKVSYYYLPTHLKRCFAHCSLLPKGYEFCVREIVLLWMAEDLLEPDAGKEMEESGHGYFQELLSRSFFQQSSMDPSRFVMHDLINDLAEWAAGEIYFRMEGTLKDNKQKGLSESVRHISYNRGRFDGIKRFEVISDAKHLRTFLPVMLSKVWNSNLPSSVVHMLLKLRRLRVLSFRGYRIFNLPDSIGDLKHLRHLDLSETEIKTLPDSINNLYNLLTLRVEKCYRLKKLCTDMGNLDNLRHLYNSNVRSLEEMPLGIQKLTCLQTLCYFVVGKDTGSGLQELKSLKHLTDTLKISRLENVKDADDAREAGMHSKSTLRVLMLEWSSNNASSREADIGTQVLDMLKPHQKLEELIIRGYSGTSFPIWLGDSSFSNLVHLRLIDCGICASLPSVGNLPHLKYLFVSGMARIKSVGTEFYGYGCSVPFPSLETLCFMSMQEWEHWIPRECSLEDEDFPKLRELRIVRCSKLQGRLPECLPSLERLVIQGCEELLVSLPSLPALCKLEVDGCKEVAWRNAIYPSSLNAVNFRGMSNQGFLTGLSMQELPKLKELKIQHCQELTDIWQNEIGLLKDVSFLHQLEIGNCPQLLSLVVEEEENRQQGWLPGTIQYLEFRYCELLAKLPQALLSLSSLVEMHITSCNKLISFPEAALPSQLRIIEIVDCNSLESLPESWMEKTSSLQILDIHGCKSLTYIARLHLPPSLKRLKINWCRNLKTFIEEDQLSVMDEEDISSNNTRCHSLLEYLRIEKCRSLSTMWSKNELPATLEHLEVVYCSSLAFLSMKSNLPKALKFLRISGCPKLESISERLDSSISLETISILDCKSLTVLPDSLHKLRLLQRVSICKCPDLVSFPKEGLPSQKLTDLCINLCEKLEALPNRMYNLTSLRHLVLKKCPSIVSFPEHGFPTNLHSLAICNLKICKPLFDWGLHRFTSLRHLSISGGCPDMLSFPPENTRMILPASLSALSIHNFPNLEHLSSISEELTSLELLTLSYCPKLKYFPENGLPASLLQLFISSCPLLTEKCKMNGEYWLMITSNIPYIRIDGKCLFDASTEED